MRTQKCDKKIGIVFYLLIGVIVSSVANLLAHSRTNPAKSLNFDLETI
jgi:tetrahydromethanopterin S-methyltransferase subunit G